MAALSDTTIIAAIKTLIEGDATIYDVSDTLKINKVFTEKQTVGPAQQNYCEIISPGQSIITSKKGGIKQKRMGETNITELIGNSQRSVRPFTILFTFKQILKENNARIYDVVANFRNAIKADETLSTSGIDGSKVLSWGYSLNDNNQMIIDGVGLTLEIFCTEAF